MLRRQVVGLKNGVDELQLVTNAFFPMFDNLDNAVQEKSGEVREL